MRDTQHPHSLFNRPYAAAALAIALAGLAAGCSSRAEPPPPAAGGNSTQGMATVKLVKPDGTQTGQAVLTALPQGVEIALTAEGLAPGAHGFHIHANGSCAPGPDAATGKTVDFGAAGGHFDPGSSNNHGHPGDAAHKSHAGELPNLTADAAGKASARYVNTQVTLAEGPASVIGRTLVVHADADDYQTDPAGNSGARILCGRIERSQMQSSAG